MSLPDQLLTPRLLLRRPAAADIPKIMEYAGDERISAMTLNIPHPYTEIDAIYWVNLANQGAKEGSGYVFGVRLRESDEFIGAIGLHVNQRFNRAELGYWMGPPHWSQGYTSEAAAAILEFGFQELKLNKILATHLVENPASGKVMINNGMIKEGTLVEHYKKDEKYRSVVQYRLTRAEYLERQGLG